MNHWAVKQDLEIFFYSRTLFSVKVTVPRRIHTPAHCSMSPPLFHTLFDPHEPWRCLAIIPLFNKPHDFTNPMGFREPHTIPAAETPKCLAFTPFFKKLYDSINPIGFHEPHTIPATIIPTYLAMTLLLSESHDSTSPIRFHEHHTILGTQTSSYSAPTR